MRGPDAAWHVRMVFAGLTLYIARVSNLGVLKMADNFNSVTLAFDKATYNQGDTMTLTISGQAVSSAGSTVTEQPTVTVVASDGTTAALQPTAASIAISTTTNLPTLIQSVNDAGGRTWVIAANGLTATATA